METKEVIEQNSKYVMNSYGRIPVSFEKGEGTKIWDADGKEYLDFVAGIAVTNLGHGNKKVVDAIKAQAEKFKEQLLEFMQSNNIQTLKSDEYSITYVPDSVKITLDKKKLFTEHPKIREQDYIKTSPKKAYLDITLKNLKN